MRTERDFQTSAQNGTVDRRDDDIRAVLQRSDDVIEVWRFERFAEFGDVRARKEGAARAAQHDRVDIRPRPQFLHIGDNSLAHCQTQRVDGRRVNDDGRDAVVNDDLRQCAHVGPPEIRVRIGR